MLINIDYETSRDIALKVLAEEYQTCVALANFARHYEYQHEMANTLKAAMIYLGGSEAIKNLPELNR